MYARTEQVSKQITDNESQFLTAGERRRKKLQIRKKEKSRMNHLMVLDWNWRNQYQLMVFHAYSDRYT